MHKLASVRIPFFNVETVEAMNMSNGIYSRSKNELISHAKRNKESLSRCGLALSPAQRKTNAIAMERFNK